MNDHGTLSNKLNFTLIFLYNTTCTEIFPKVYKFLRTTDICMRATPTFQNRVSPRVASSPYVPTDYPLMYK